MSVSAWDKHKHALLHSYMLVFNQRIIAPPSRSPTLSPNGINHSLIQQPKFNQMLFPSALTCQSIPLVSFIGLGEVIDSPHFAVGIQQDIWLRETVERPNDQLWKGSLAKVQNLLAVLLFGLHSRLSMYRIKYIIHVHIFSKVIWWYIWYMFITLNPPKNESFWFENSWHGSENRLVPILVIQRLAPTWWLSRVLSMTTEQKLDKWMLKHVNMMARKWVWHVMTRACSFLFWEPIFASNSSALANCFRLNLLDK